MWRKLRLALLPAAACQRTRGKEQNLDRIREAIAVAVARPEIVNAHNWLHLE